MSEIDANDIYTIEPKVSDIGSFEVRRYLPSSRKRAVGPFIFFDEMGPTVLKDGEGMDVRAHPHIGLSTLTWLIEGEIVHRDSLGYIQTIRPGEVNLMTAGRGIVHSERSPKDMRGGERPLFGLQIWMVLPSDQQEIEPDFQHVDKKDIPRLNKDGVDISIIAGEAYGLKSPVKTHAPTIYLDVKGDKANDLTLPTHYDEIAIFMLEGKVEIDGQSFNKGDFIVLPDVSVVKFSSSGRFHFVLLGGQKLKERRYMWWNFVSTSKERIEQAKQDWETGNFGEVVDEDEYIPLPSP